MSILYYDTVAFVQQLVLIQLEQDNITRKTLDSYFLLIVVQSFGITATSFSSVILFFIHRNRSNYLFTQFYAYSAATNSKGRLISLLSDAQKNNLSIEKLSLPGATSTCVELETTFSSHIRLFFWPRLNDDENATQALQLQYL